MTQKELGILLGFSEKKLVLELLSIRIMLGCLRDHIEKICQNFDIKKKFY